MVGRFLDVGVRRWVGGGVYWAAGDVSSSSASVRDWRGQVLWDGGRVMIQGGVRHWEDTRYRCCKVAWFCNGR